MEFPVTDAPLLGGLPAERGAQGVTQGHICRVDALNQCHGKNGLTEQSRELIFLFHYSYITMTAPVFTVCFDIQVPVLFVLHALPAHHEHRSVIIQT